MIEIDLVEWIRKHADVRHSRLVLGIGDDCAIFRPRNGEDLLFTTDQLIEDVHFLKKAKPEIIGERALARSLSDIAAMGGEPRFCLVSLAAPSRKGTRWMQAFFRGLLALARRTNTPLAGGDLAHDDKVHCDVMVCGGIPRGKALRRDGARPGDGLYVSGRLGKPWDRRIEPRLSLGQALVGKATACIDLSDGLSLDLHRLCQASRVAAQLDLVPIQKGATLERALHGGEDYELLFTIPYGKPALPRMIRIGTILRGAPGTITFQGRRLKLGGYDHFKRSGV